MKKREISVIEFLLGDVDPNTTTVKKSAWYMVIAIVISQIFGVLSAALKLSRKR